MRKASYGRRQLARATAEALSACSAVPRTKKVSSLITERRRMSPAKFAIPEERAYPIHDAYHAKLAIAHLVRSAGRHPGLRVSPPGRATARKVLSAVRQHWPEVYGCESDLIHRVKDLYRL